MGFNGQEAFLTGPPSRILRSGRWSTRTGTPVTGSDPLTDTCSAVTPGECHPRRSGDLLLSVERALPGHTAEAAAGPHLPA